MKTRIITALIGVGFASFLIRNGGYPFSLLIIFLAMIAWFEFKKMVKNSGSEIFLLTSGSAVLALNLAAAFGLERFNLLIVTFSVLGIMLQALYFYKRKKYDSESSLSIVAMLYSGLMFSYVILLRNIDGIAFYIPKIGMMEAGEAFLWMALLGTWASDTFAYFFGIAFGKHKMTRISPKKSLEGLVAGFFGCMLITFFIGVKLMSLALAPTLILGIIIGIFAPLGDLVESNWKRTFKVKDSGKLIPGHGGIFDRFDSFLYIIPITYYYVLYVFL